MFLRTSRRAPFAKALRSRVCRHFNIMNKVTGRKFEDQIKSEMTFFANKATYNLRDYQDKVIRL